MKKLFLIMIFCNLFFIFHTVNLLSNHDYKENRNIEYQNNYDEKWYDIDKTLPHTVDYSNCNLLDYVRAGDILFEENGGFGILGHLALVEGIFYDETYKQNYIRVIEVVENGVTRGILTPSRFNIKKGSIYRYKSFKEGQIEEIISYMEGQLQKPYKLKYDRNDYFENNSWYSSELIWAAFSKSGINLVSGKQEGSGFVVYPKEIISSSNQILILHYNYESLVTTYNDYYHIINCNGNTYFEEHNFSKSINACIKECSKCKFQDISFASKRELVLTNKTDITVITDKIPKKSYIIYKLNIKSYRSYMFISKNKGNSHLPINMELYDNNYTLIKYNFEREINNKYSMIMGCLKTGTYYLKIYYDMPSLNGEIITTYKASWVDD